MACDVCITAKPAVTVIGRLVDREGKPIPAAPAHTPLVGQFGGGMPVASRNDGRFEIGGVPGDEPSDIYAMHEGVVRRVEIPRPAPNLDVGDVVVDYDNRLAFVQVSIEMEGTPRFGGGVTAVLLVSSDGERLFTPMVHVSYEPLYADWVKERDTIAVPPGTYYVAPGTLLLESTQEQLIHLARSGRDLSKTNIPHFTVNVEEHLVVPFDPSAAKGAIQAEAASPNK